MPIWGKTDTKASAPKYLLDGANVSIVPAAAPARDYGGLPKQQDINNAFFVDTTEAAVTSNRAAGIKTPGWNLVHTYTDAQGKTRKRVESLVPMKVTAGNAGDAGVANNTTTEDATVADS